MPLTAYEKFNVEPGKSVIAKGLVKFNCLNHQFTPKGNDTEPNPAPRYSIELQNPQFYGDRALASALHSKMYGGNQDKVSFVNKGHFTPAVFDKSDAQMTADELIPDGKCLAANQAVLVHVRSFAGKNGNVGASFDAIKLPCVFNEVKLENIGLSGAIFEDLKEVDF